MNRKIVLTGVIAVYLVTGVVACIQFGKMDAAFSVAGETADIALHSPAYLDFLPFPETEGTEEGGDSYVLPETMEEKASVESAELQDVQYSFTAIHKNGRLFVRLEPSMNGEIIGFLAPGVMGDVVELGSDWALVTAGDLTGYVSTRYLSLEEMESGN